MEENVIVQNNEEEVNLQNQGQISSEVDLLQQGLSSENQVEYLHKTSKVHHWSQETGHLRESSQLKMQQKDDDQLERQAEQNHVHDGGQDEMQPENQQQYPNMQTMNNPQAQAAKSENGSKQVSYSVLLPLLLPSLRKKQAMLLQANYFKLQKMRSPKRGFVRNLRNIVGEQRLRQAVLLLKMPQASRL
ncbi:hypothetical protein IFM89_008003 [Coptis chinensis]|uniref:RST domain-containing protein n=1 Tax=Coptis chinensis TaxID=261450 RepID=A0A835INY1_9MAGN|nr:hypothetical protein IFM89_008003 [Coptis chinensis]